MQIIVSNAKPEPLYEQIETQIKEAIISGILSENDILPSVRELSNTLNVSVITTLRAYKDLENQGFVLSAPGKGYYVLKTNPQIAKENALKKIEKHLGDVVQIASSSNITKKEIKEILKILMERK